MKLPGRTEGAVQQLGSVDPGVYAQRGEAFGGMVDVAAGANAEWYEKKGEEANRKAILGMSRRSVQIQEDYGDKRSFTADELKALGIPVPDEYTNQKELGPDGKPMPLPDAEIPAEDVLPQYVKRQLEKEAQLQAEKIPGSVRRDEFLTRQQQLIDNRYEGAVAKAQAAREAKLLTEYELDMMQAEIDGDFPAAHALTDGHSIMTPDEKEIEHIRLYKVEESRMLFRLKNTDIYNADGTMDMRAARALLPELAAQAERLRSSDYGAKENGPQLNSFEQSEREAEIRGLTAMIKAITADADDATKADMAAFYNTFYNDVDDPDTSRADALELIDRGLARGILDDADVTRLRKYVNDVKGGGGIEQRQTAADTTFIEFDNMSVPELQQADIDGRIDELAGVVSVTQLEHLKNKSKEGTSNDAAWKENIDYAEAELGLILPNKPSKKEKITFAHDQAAVRELIYGQFREFERTTGDPPDADQRKAITDRVLISTSQEKKRRYIGLFGPHEYRNKEDKLADVPYAQWAQISDLLEEVDETGLPPTASDFKAMSDVLIAIEEAGWDYPSNADVLEAIEVIDAGGNLKAWAKKKRSKPRS